MSLPVALQLYSIRDDAKADLYGTLKKVKNMGYDGVEFAGLYDNEPEKVKEMCEELGLVPVSAHVALDALRADAKGEIAKYAKVGVKYVVVPYLTEKDRPEAGNFDKVIADITEIAKEAKKQGIELCYHNHDFEFNKIGEEYALDVLYNSISADLLKTQLDTCWVNVGGEDPSQYVMKYAGRQPTVHLKDFKGGKSEGMYELIGIDKKATVDSKSFELRPVGFGVQNWPNILEACEKAGAKWVIVEQDRPSLDRTPLECVAMARNYLKLLNY